MQYYNTDITKSQRSHTEFKGEKTDFELELFEYQEQ